MTRRLIFAAVVTVALAGCRWTPPPFTQHAPPRAYCFGEGGRIDECVSPGSPGGLGR